MGLPAAIRYVSLFSGVGTLDLGVRGAFPEARCVLYVEREAACIEVLVSRMQAGHLDDGPVYTDIGTLDARPFRGHVDLVVAGPPCQPYSVAGQRRGNDDDRAWGDGAGPIFHLARVIEECGPSVVFFENVSPWVGAGYFREFGERLSGLGYTIESPLFLRASDVGASHRRERVFVLAWHPRAKQ